MLVRDGRIDKMFIEPERPGDPYEVSDADTMLAYLAPQAKKPESVLLFSRPGCPHCARAKDSLARHGLRYEEVVIGRDVSTSGLHAATGERTVPQIFIGGRRIGGADALETYLQEERG
jgi:glutaredoxin-like protein